MATWDKESGDIVPRTLVRYQGVFDFEKLLRELHAWLKNKGYFIKYKDQTEERKPQGLLFRKEWICDRQPTPYYKFYIQTEFICRDLTEVLVEKDGKKIKMMKGDLELVFFSKWERNYNRIFPKTFFGNLCRKLYERYVIYRRNQSYWGKIYSETYEFIDVAKAVLDGFRS